MEIISDLRQRHLAGWTKAMRELKPPEMENTTDLPEVEFQGVSVKAAITAGWFDGVTDAGIVDDMKGGEVKKLSAEVWAAFREARRIDPN